MVPCKAGSAKIIDESDAVALVWLQAAAQITVDFTDGISLLSRMWNTSAVVSQLTSFCEYDIG